MPEREPIWAGAVPIPNGLFDEVLPQLSDTALRVLLVVFRATRGWREGNGQGGWQYKRRDWISHRQLQKRTGRGSEAVTRAVQLLVVHGLIIVEDTAGRPLASPEERRRYLGRLYFRPGEMWKTAAPRHPAKAGRTTDKRENNIKERRAGGCEAVSGWQRAVPASPLRDKQAERYGPASGVPISRPARTYVPTPHP